MKIGIYARGLSRVIGGVKEYIRLMALAMINNLEDDDELFIIHNNKTNLFDTKKKNVKEILLDSDKKLVCDFIERLPEDCIILRLVSDARKDVLVAPEWMEDKVETIKSIEAEFLRRGTCQGTRDQGHGKNKNR